MVVNSFGRRLSLTAAVICLFLLCAARAGAVTAPTADPFYAQPANIATFANGAIIRDRPVTMSGAQSSATAAAYQLMFKTTNATGQPVAAVTTLLIPAAPAAGPRRLASYQTAYDSLSLACAPSYTLQGGNGGGGDTATLETTLIANELAQGWDVNIPDYEGLDSEWVVGPMIGHAVLDSIKADESFASAQLEGAATEVTVNGYSGGSEATTWAAALKPSYAPTLNMVGAAAGGNFPDLDYTLSQFDNELWYGTEIGVLTSFERAFPQLGLSGFLNVAGQALSSTDAVDGGGCGGSTLSTPGGTASKYTTFPTSAAMSTNPTIETVLGYGSLMNGPWTTVPMYLYNGDGDELAHIAPVNTWVKSLCGHGVTVDYDADPLGQEHIQALTEYWPAALAYLEARFAGTAPPDNCPAGSPTSVTPAPTVTPLGCETSGSLTSSHIGDATLGTTISALTRQLGTAQAVRGAYTHSYCSGTAALYVGIGTLAERNAVPRSARAALRNHVIWALSANPAYTLDALQVAQQATPAALAKAGFAQVMSGWYARAGKSATVLLEVKDNTVAALGIASRTLTRYKHAANLLYSQLNAVAGSWGV